MRLIQGDCFEVLESLSEKSIDLILTDPPYGKTKNSWDKTPDIKRLWSLFERVSKNGSVILFCVDMFMADLMRSNRKRFKLIHPWVKNKAVGHFNAKKYPLNENEFVIVFSKGQITYNPQKTEGHKPVNRYLKRNKVANNCYGPDSKAVAGGGQTDRYPQRILYFDVVNNDDPIRIHPNQKPVEMLEYLIKTYSNEGDTVLDCYGGSFATGVACLRSGRHFIGIEREQKYYEPAVAWVKLEESKMNDGVV